MASRVVIASTARTPFARASKGELKDTRPDTMAALVIKEALHAARASSQADIEDVVLGCAMPEAEQGMNVARIAALAAGLPDDVPAHDRQPLLLVGRAVDRARAPTASPPAPTTSAIAGGVETHVDDPDGRQQAVARTRSSSRSTRRSTRRWASPPRTWPRKFGVSRAEQDAFALRSHTRATTAQKAGKLRRRDRRRQDDHVRRGRQRAGR